MENEEKSWKEKALEAANILKKISQPPLQYATVTGVNNDSVDIALSGGNTFVVNYDMRLKGKFELGQTVKIMPETLAVVNIEGDIKSRYSTVVKDVLSDGRIKIEDSGNCDKVIQTAVKNLKVGNDILVDNSKNVVIENLGHSSKAYKIDKLAQISWDKIGGLENTIQEIRDCIEGPITNRELYSKFPNKKPAKGILLYGPPGCGKTMLGKAVAYNLAKIKQERDGSELNGHFLYASGPEFLRKYVGVGAEKVRSLFAQARENSSSNNDPVVIFIDEPEAVLKKRGSGISSDAHDSIVNQFLVEMDGMKSLDNIVVMLATNRQEMLDSAVTRPGRIDRKIYVPRPDKNGCERIFDIYLENMPMEGSSFKSKRNIRSSFANYAASLIYDNQLPILDIFYGDGSKDVIHYKHIFSGASAVSIIGRATDLTIKRYKKGTNLKISKDDLSLAVESEYRENRNLTNQVTEYDIKSVVKDRFNEISEIKQSSMSITY